MTPARTAAARSAPRRSATNGSRTTRSRTAPPRSTRTVRRSTARPGTASPAPRRRPWLRVVPAPRARRLPFLIASFVILGVLVVGVTSLQAVVSQGSFRMQELARHNVELQQDYGRLKLQVAELSSPGRIAAKARRLGFHLPEPDDVRTLPVKGSVPANAGAGTPGRPALSLKGVLELRP